MNDLLAHALGGIVELDWQCDEDLPCAYADSAQLELALMNLVINARDAMPAGGMVQVRGENRHLAEKAAMADLPPGDYVVLSVIDTGCGIAPELLEQVMEPFFTTKATGKGTGLGLSMVYGFAKQSGGAIRVESEVDHGTRVEIWLPAAEGGPTPVSRDAPAAPAAPDPSLSILLVDDHDGVRATTATMLEDLGHKVVDVGDGAGALQLLRETPDAFDVVLTDYAMPRLCGVELVRQARELRPALPAVIITGYAEPGVVTPFSQDVPVLVKPFDNQQLRHSLRKACCEASPHRAP
jgi:CheY-like chemotaxis protein